MDGITNSERTRLQICNIALTNLHTTGISSFPTTFATGSPEQKLCFLHYEKDYRIALGQANWSFAITKSSLIKVDANDLLGEDTLSGWKYAYEDHSSYIKILDINNKSDFNNRHNSIINSQFVDQRKFDIEQRIYKAKGETPEHSGSIIFCDIDNAVGTVLSSFTDVSVTPLDFQECVAFKLSASIAPGILGTGSSRSFIAQLEGRYNNKIKEVWVKDMGNHYTPERKQSRLISCRY